MPCCQSCRQFSWKVEERVLKSFLYDVDTIKYYLFNCLFIYIYIYTFLRFRKILYYCTQQNLKSTDNTTLARIKNANLTHIKISLKPYQIMTAKPGHGHKSQQQIIVKSCLNHTEIIHNKFRNMVFHHTLGSEPEPKGIPVGKRKVLQGDHSEWRFATSWSSTVFEKSDWYNP